MTEERQVDRKCSNVRKQWDCGSADAAVGVRRDQLRAATGRLVGGVKAAGGNAVSSGVQIPSVAGRCGQRHLLVRHTHHRQDLPQESQLHLFRLSIFDLLPRLDSTSLEPLALPSARLQYHAFAEPVRSGRHLATVPPAQNASFDESAFANLFSQFASWRVSAGDEWSFPLPGPMTFSISLLVCRRPHDHDQVNSKSLISSCLLLLDQVLLNQCCSRIPITRYTLEYRSGRMYLTILFTPYGRRAAIMTCCLSAYLLGVRMQIVQGRRRSWRQEPWWGLWWTRSPWHRYWLPF